jgi:hypothetical protein
VNNSILQLPLEGERLGVMNATSDQLIAVRQPIVRLTPVKAVDGQQGGQLLLPTYEIIAYSQGQAHTRLHLTGRRMVEVKETTQEIDLLVRAAAR